MKDLYQNMFRQIHVPEELNNRVLLQANTRNISVKKSRTPYSINWLRPAICMLCIFALLVGGFYYTFPNIVTPDSGTPQTDIPFGGLAITASAAELPSSNKNGGLGIALDSTDGKRCIFQIRGVGIQNVSLHITDGLLFRDDNTEAQTRIEDIYSEGQKYGVELTKDSGTLTVTANNNETFSYILTMENLKFSKSEDGQATLVPTLSGDPSEKFKGIYVVDSSKCQWMEWPVEGTYIIDCSKPYGYSPNGKFHTGIDIPALEETAVFAADDGNVIEAGTLPDIGNYVILNHGNGLVTQYNHCKSIQVSVGDSIRKGDVIASVGKTGMATGSHLHFEIRQDGVPQDPTAYFKADMREKLSMEYI